MNGNPKLDLKVSVQLVIEQLVGKKNQVCAGSGEKKSNKCSKFLPQLRQKMIQLKKSNSTHDTSYNP